MWEMCETDANGHGEGMAAGDDELLEAISTVLPQMLHALHALDYVGRHLHPPHLPALVEAVMDSHAPVRAGLAQFEAVEFPDHLADFKACVQRGAEHICAAFEGLQTAIEAPDGRMAAYRAMGQRTRAVEALYPVAAMLGPVSRFFVEASRRDDQALLAKLAQADVSRADVGIIHAGNDRRSRGGFSLYVPEYYNADQPHPLIVALHGGSGHGRDFLWTWIVEARTRGAILLSPTARESTWSLMGPDVDSVNIDGMVEHVRSRWHIDGEHLLLTGMSDGGTFSYVSGLRGEAPFTHLAPCSASFHPLLLDGTERRRLKDLPIYLMHGTLDWMFPVDIARTANAALGAAGAKVHYREIDDLSHTWPRDENPKIMDWFLAQ